MTGKNGELTFKSGEVHSGEFKNGVLHGEGLAIDQSGFKRRQGMFENGMLNG